MVYLESLFAHAVSKNFVAFLLFLFKDGADLRMEVFANFPTRFEWLYLFDDLPFDVDVEVDVFVF